MVPCLDPGSLIWVIPAKFSESPGRPVPKGFTESTYFRVIIGSQFAKLLPEGDKWKDTRSNQTFTGAQLRDAIDRHKADKE